MTTKRRSVISAGFNYTEIIRRLHSANLVIHTIPGEEWVLSCFVHTSLLVDVYTLTGKIPGKTKTVTFQCGRLGEILVKFLRYGRKVQYHSHHPHSDDGITSFTRHGNLLAETFEEDMLIRLRDGDVIFRLIPGEHWRLTNTAFGQFPAPSFNHFYLAEENTFGTSNVRKYVSNDLGHILLEFLCQNSTFVEKQGQSKIVAFKSKELR